MKIIDLGLIGYRDAYEYQRRRVEEVASDVSEGFLLLAEHSPTITIGRTGSWKNILCTEEQLKQKGILVCDTDRGGDVTYHCPGQILIYPIIRLERKCREIHKFLRFLEEVCIRFLNNFRITGSKIENLTGVWVRNKKIASIGIGIKHWVTYHGMAININNNLQDLSLINPCGIPGLEMTSLKEELGNEVEMPKAKDILIKEFRNLYGDFFRTEKVAVLA